MIDANTVLNYILVAVGGFFLKFIWDKLVEKRNNTEEKAVAYDKKIQLMNLKFMLMQNSRDIAKCIEKLLAT